MTHIHYVILLVGSKNENIKFVGKYVNKHIKWGNPGPEKKKKPTCQSPNSLTIHWNVLFWLSKGFWFRNYIFVHEIIYVYICVHMWM